jgi:hypothetical protein
VRACYVYVCTATARLSSGTHVIAFHVVDSPARPGASSFSQRSPVGGVLVVVLVVVAVAG